MVDKQPKGAFYMSSKTTRRKLTLDSNSIITILFKQDQEHEVFKDITAKYDVELKINAMGLLIAKGDKEKTLELERRVKNPKKVIKTFDDLRIVLSEEVMVENVEDTQDEPVKFDIIPLRDYKGNTNVIKPKNEHQKDLIESIMKNKVTLAMGSAGTGKSLISLAVGLKLLESKKIKKIVISKPAVDAGPGIGFLPGGEDEKLGPYTASVMNLIMELIGIEKRDKYIKDGLIEIQNIGYLRGMTLGSQKMGGVFFLLDEAQNVDFHQNKMILSRIGDHPESRIVYAGDQLQSDLKYKKDTLSLIYSIIKDSPYVGSVVFNRDDICRSPTVRDLMERIETYEEEESLKNKR